MSQDRLSSLFLRLKYANDGMRNILTIRFFLWISLRFVSTRKNKLPQGNICGYENEVRSLPRGRNYEKNEKLTESGRTMFVKDFITKRSRLQEAFLGDLCCHEILARPKLFLGRSIVSPFDVTHVLRLSIFPTIARENISLIQTFRKSFACNYFIRR